MIVRTITDIVRSREQVVGVCHLLSAGQYGRTLIYFWCIRTAIGTYAASCWRAAAPELLFIPSKREATVTSPTSCKHTQHIYPLYTVRQLIILPLVITGRCDIPPSSQSLSVLCLRATCPPPRITFDLVACILVFPKTLSA